MSKVVNIENLTAELNKFRMENQNKSFTSQELYEILEKMGFNKNVSRRITKLFEFEKLGTAKLFVMPKAPIHKSQVGAIYNKIRLLRNSHKTVETGPEAVIEMLKDQGYQIRKCVGFDLDRFQKENPVLYKKYLKYEIV